MRAKTRILKLERKRILPARKVKYLWLEKYADLGEIDRAAMALERVTYVCWRRLRDSCLTKSSVIKLIFEK